MNTFRAGAAENGNSLIAELVGLRLPECAAVEPPRERALGGARTRAAIHIGMQRPRGK